MKKREKQRKRKKREREKGEILLREHDAALCDLIGWLTASHRERIVRRTISCREGLGGVVAERMRERERETGSFQVMWPIAMMPASRECDDDLSILQSRCVGEGFMIPCIFALFLGSCEYTYRLYRSSMED